MSGDSYLTFLEPGPNLNVPGLIFEVPGPIFEVPGPIHEVAGLRPGGTRPTLTTAYKPKFEEVYYSQIKRCDRLKIIDDVIHFSDQPTSSRPIVNLVLKTLISPSSEKGLTPMSSARSHPPPLPPTSKNPSPISHFLQRWALITILGCVKA